MKSLDHEGELNRTICPKSREGAWQEVEWRGYQLSKNIDFAEM
jgi:hypothetical protein